MVFYHNDALNIRKKNLSERFSKRSLSANKPEKHLLSSFLKSRQIRQAGVGTISIKPDWLPRLQRA
jgi:hypothetical protein